MKQPRRQHDRPARLVGDGPRLIDDAAPRRPVRFLSDRLGLATERLQAWGQFVSGGDRQREMIEL